MDLHAEEYRIGYICHGYMIFVFYAFICPGTMTTHAESINPDLQRGLDRRLRHITFNTEQNQLAIKVSADNQYYRNASGYVLIVEFLRIQILTDRTSGTRTRAIQMLTYKFVEICSTPLTTVPWLMIHY